MSANVLERLDIPTTKLNREMIAEEDHDTNSNNAKYHPLNIPSHCGGPELFLHSGGHHRIFGFTGYLALPDVWLLFSLKPEDHTALVFSM